MLKIITWLLTKKEARLSKKTAINEELKLYRNLLDQIDKYNYETKGISTFRHYRFNITIIHFSSKFITIFNSFRWSSLDSI